MKTKITKRKTYRVLIDQTWRMECLPVCVFY